MESNKDDNNNRGGSTLSEKIHIMDKNLYTTIALLNDLKEVIGEVNRALRHHMTDKEAHITCITRAAEMKNIIEDNKELHKEFRKMETIMHEQEQTFSNAMHNLETEFVQHKTKMNTYLSIGATALVILELILRYVV